MLSFATFNIDFVPRLTLGEAATAVILGITALVVWGYTRAAQKSNEIQERPVLNLYLREETQGGNTRRNVRLRNVGRGPAYNISFAKIETEGCTYIPVFREPNPILEGNGDEKIIWFSVQLPDGVEAYDDLTGFQFFLFRLFPRSIPSEKEYEQRKRVAGVFLISYDGVNGESYYSIFRLYSKIWPIMEVYDLVVEFVGSGKGHCTPEQAREKCSAKPAMRSPHDRRDANELGV